MGEREAEDMLAYGSHNLTYKGHDGDAACIEMSNEWNKPVDEELAIEVEEMLTDDEKARIDAEKAKKDAAKEAKGVDLMQTQNVLKAPAAAIDALLAGVSGNTFSAVRLVSPTSCEGGMCAEWGEECAEWVDTSHGASRLRKVAAVSSQAGGAGCVRLGTM